jgi:hypothetical protein
MNNFRDTEHRLYVLVIRTWDNRLEKCVMDSENSLLHNLW